MTASRQARWAKLFRAEAFLALALLVTGLATVFRDALTRESIVIAAGDANEKFYGYVFDNKGSGTNARAWMAGPMDWTCHLGSGAGQPFCGFGLLLDVNHDGKGIDLSRYDSFDLDLEFDGGAEFLRAVIKNGEKPASDEKLPNGFKPLAERITQSTIPVQAGEHEVRVQLSDFVVAQWWKDYNQDQSAKPIMNNVVAIELGIGNDSKLGDHRLRLKSIRFNRTIISTEAWYLGIGFCWILIIGVFLFQRQRQVERWKTQLAERMLNSVPQVVFSIGPDGLPDFVSEQWSEHYGGDPSDLLGRGWLRVIHPDDRRKVIEDWAKAYSAGAPFEAEYRVRFPDGSCRWAEVRARPELHGEGKVTRWYGTWTDSHQRVLAQQALKASERLYRGILEASIDCVAVLSPTGVVELVNGPGVAATELDRADAIEGRPFTALWQRTSQPMISAELAKARAGEVVRFQKFCPTAKGTPKWWDVVLTPMLDESGEVRGILAISRDVTADREKSEQLRWASEHDALTSLPNRRAFQARLQTATLRAMQTGEKVGLLIVDLDHFKHVNDSFGHIAGDAVLEAVAERLRGSLRKNDFVARVGGDEFAIILEDVHSREDVQALGQKVFRELQAPLKLHGRAFSAGASLGGALFPQDAQCANDLFKMADTALYALKGSGRGGTMLFHPHMLEEVEKAAAQLGVARNALSEKTVVPVYQPKVEVQSGRIVGFEALLRWKHPRNGLQLPATVEEAFKDYELAAKIGELMQNSVAAHLSSWLSANIQFGRVSINAAPAEFLRDDYAERLLAVLDEHRVPASALEVEVTEHALLDQGPEYVARALALLKQAGVRVSLDDFGTGYSSLSHLRDFPVDLVKIDKSFVQQMGEDPEIASIVSAVINLARSIDIDVVAEGVETPAQLDLLRSMGCRLAQGHLFGRPIEEAEVVKLLDQARAAA